VQRQWTQVGEAYSGTEELKSRFEAVVQAVEWQDLPCTLGMTPGKAVRAAILEFQIPNVQRVGCSLEMAPLGVLAVEGIYSDGVVRIYFVDQGDVLVPVMSDQFALDYLESLGKEEE